MKPALRTESDRMIRVADAAKYLLTNSHRILAEIHSGRLPAINIARDPGGRPRWRIRQSALDSWLDSRTTTPPAPARRRRKKSDDEVKFF